jgi:Fungal Zn(2)-Cys(6) binuclear cluster domain
MSKPILPLPGGNYLPQQPQQPTQSQAPGGSSPQPPGQGKPTYSKRGKITIVACVPCRKRKTKCDGKRPECTQCQSREGQCHYDMSEEQRRLTYLRENVEHLAEEKNTLEALIWNLRSSSEEEAAEILRRLRTGTDPHTLTQHIQAGRSLAQVRRDNLTSQAATAGK